MYKFYIGTAWYYGGQYPTASQAAYSTEEEAEKFASSNGGYKVFILEVSLGHAPAMASAMVVSLRIKDLLKPEAGWQKVRKWSVAANGIYDGGEVRVALGKEFPWCGFDAEGERQGASGVYASDPHLDGSYKPPTGLRRLPGVGKMLEGRLNALGITKVEQIAAMSEEDIARLDDALSLKGNTKRDDWAGKARELAADAAAI
jgi:hypothetical protein